MTTSSLRIDLRNNLAGVIPTLATAALFAAFAAGPVAAGETGDAEAGAKTFRKCKACHVADSGKHRVGPSLQTVFGRTPGTAEGYKKYSKAMVAFGEGGAVWDAETLDSWLTKPKDLVPKTKMSFPGLKKPEDRTNVIAFLKQAAGE